MSDITQNPNGTFVRPYVDVSASAGTAYAPAVTPVDKNGNAGVGLNTLLAGEDQTNSVFAVLTKLFPNAAYAPLLATNFGTVTKALVKATPAQIYSVRVSNANAAARYLLLHNKATAPVATDVPLYAFYIPAGAAVTIGGDFFTANGAYFSTGVGWSISTTAATFTDSATASDHVIAVHYT